MKNIVPVETEVLRQITADCDSLRSIIETLEHWGVDEDVMDEMYKYIGCIEESVYVD